MPSKKTSAAKASPKKKTPQKAPSHNALRKEAMSALPKSASSDLKEFTKRFYNHVPAEDMAIMGAEMMAKTVADHWKTLKSRKADDLDINIYIKSTGKNEGAVGYTVIDVVNPDMAFLVDSVAAALTKDNHTVHTLIHPLTQQAEQEEKARDKDTPLSYEFRDPKQISHLHVELEGAITDAQSKDIKKTIRDVVRDVRFATRDWLAMRDKLRQCQKGLSLAPKDKYSDDQIEEYIHFLEYMHKDNFTLLGYREYRFTEKNGTVKSETIKGQSLGLFHDDVKPVYINEKKESLPPELQEKRRDLPPLTVSKVNRLSTVHRAVPLDAVAVKQFDNDGHVCGECLFIGLFTSVTYSRSIQDVPLLRRKADMVTLHSDFDPGSHDYKALRHILEKYPRDELFQIGTDQLLDVAVSILRLQERQRIALYMRPDPFERYVSCLVYVPRERYDTRLRTAIQKILESELKGTISNFHTTLDDSPLARILYSIQIDRENPPKYKVAKIEEKLQEVGRVWSERLKLALVQAETPDSHILETVQKYGEAFPTGYRENHTPKQAVYDIDKIEETLDTGRIAIDLYSTNECGDDELRVKMYHNGSPITLSDVLPILKNMGLQVVSEWPYKIKPAGLDRPIWIHDFLAKLDAKHQGVEALNGMKAKFEEALQRIWHRQSGDDSLNKLVLGADLNWHEVTILRCYTRYLRQARSPFSLRYLERALTSNPEISRYIVDLFKTMHDPAQHDSEKAIEKAENAAKKLYTKIEKALEAVASLDEDRILRSVLNLTQATLRTNFFQTTDKGAPKSYLSMKFDSSKIDHLPAPRPYREIFVASPRVEGVHLRGDVIARGGLRWSDRHEDFRTEVLGLMKAQQVKNSLIVPMGAKGGFVVKRPPKEGGREAFLAEGIECYKIFLRGLLDITDNRKGAKVIPPKDVVRHDGDDPYLVVAADKGTATFSDIANSLSLEYGHWLGDAFASGGSAGYDHKKMGITARGAWESVKRHFRELHHDTQSQPFDVIGVGDMGGDVFGNGMLLSEHIRMVGAFNHLHIVCDPDPDPQASFKERRRLFDAVKGWDGYDTKKLSKGGRIYRRDEKSLELTPEIRKRFDLDKDRCTPNELIRAMLRARADLLWFGGIGTYIKAESETNTDVGDKSNDSLRINASEARARVIGEGANLAITQLGRIEFAKAGGKLNADFIDNSAGVNTSDVEVNIKILLAEIMRKKEYDMTLSQRNYLLEKMTGEVADLVLYNNYQQAQGISLMELQAVEHLSAQAQFLLDLERNEGLNRKLEGLPGSEEIEERIRNGKGMTRPELSVMQAYAKISYSRALLKSDIPELKEVEQRWLLDYFPKPLRKKYETEIREHRLHREIIATGISTGVINRMGPTFIDHMIDKTGATIAEITKAYIIVREAFGLRDLWKQIEALDNKVPAQIQLRAMRDIARMVQRETLWFLTRLGRPPEIGKDFKEFSGGIKKLRAKIGDLVPEDTAMSIEQRTKDGVNDGLPYDLAHQIACIPTLGAACDIIRISLDCKTDIEKTARVYFGLNSYFHLNWLRKQARYLTASDRWAADAINSLIEQLYNCQAGLTVKIISDTKSLPKAKQDDVVEVWVKGQENHLELIKPLFAEIRRNGSVDLPMLIIAVQRIQSLYAG